MAAPFSFDRLKFSIKFQLNLQWCGISLCKIFIVPFKKQTYTNYDSHSNKRGWSNSIIIILLYLRIFDLNY